MSTYEEKQLEVIQKSQEYREALEAIKDEVHSACIDKNRRSGSKNSFNMPERINQKIYEIYQKFYISYNCSSGKKRWANNQWCGNTTEILGYTISYYGKEANKFYCTPPYTEEQHQAMLQALEKAALDLEQE